MNTTNFLGSLNIMTLVAAVVVVAIGFAFFLRKRGNRHPLEGKAERNVAADLDAGRPAPEQSPRA